MNSVDLCELVQAAVCVCVFAFGRTQRQGFELIHVKKLMFIWKAVGGWRGLFYTSPRFPQDLHQGGGQREVSTAEPQSVRLRHGACAMLKYPNVSPVTRRMLKHRLSGSGVAATALTPRSVEAFQEDEAAWISSVTFQLTTSRWRDSAFRQLHANECLHCQHRFLSFPPGTVWCRALLKSPDDQQTAGEEAVFLATEKAQGVTNNCTLWQVPLWITALALCVLFCDITWFPVIFVIQTQLTDLPFHSAWHACVPAPFLLWQEMVYFTWLWTVSTDTDKLSIFLFSVHRGCTGGQILFVSIHLQQ